MADVTVTPDALVMTARHQAPSVVEPLAAFSPISQLYPFHRSGEIGQTIVGELDSGTPQRRLKRRVSSVEIGIRLGGFKSDLETDFDFVKSKGGHTSFIFKDPWEYSVTGEAVGTGDASRKIYYLDHKYIDSSNITVKLNGSPTSDYVLNHERGKITFNTAPGAGVVITADYEFYRKFYFQIMNPIADCKIENRTYGFWTLDLRLKESLV